MWFTIVLAVAIVGAGIAVIVVPIVRERRQLRDHRAYQRAAAADARAEILENLGAAIAEAVAEDDHASRAVASSSPSRSQIEVPRSALPACAERDDTGSSTWCSSARSSARSGSASSSGSFWSWDDD